MRFLVRLARVFVVWAKLNLAKWLKILIHFGEISRMSGIKNRLLLDLISGKVNPDEIAESLESHQMSRLVQFGLTKDSPMQSWVNELTTTIARLKLKYSWPG